MTVSVTYNGVSVPVPINKLRGFSIDDGELSLSYDFKASATWANSNLTALRALDKTLTVVVGSWTITANVGSNASETACKILKIGSVGDADGNKTFTIEVRASLITTQTGGLRDWRNQEQIDVRGAHTIVVTGQYTGVSTGTAFAAWEAGIDTLLGAAQTIFDPTGTYESPEHRLDVNRTNRTLNFTSTIVELLLPDNVRSSGTDSQNADLHFVQWGINEVRNYDRGMVAQAPTRYQVDWSAIMPKDMTGFISLWETTIRAFVISKIQSEFGESADLTLIDTAIRYSLTGQSANGSWVVETLPGGSDLVSYEESVGYRIAGASGTKFLDGRDFSMNLYSPGISMEVVQTVTERRRNVVPALPAAPSVIISGTSTELVLKSQDRGQVVRYVGEATGDGSDSTVQSTDYLVSTTSTYIVARSAETGSGQARVVGSKSPFLIGGRV